MGGFAVDLLREAARRSCGTIPEPVIRNVPWARALSECRHNPGAAVLCMAMLPSRRALFKWVGPIVRMPVGVYARKSSGIIIDRARNLARYSIAVVRGTAPIVLLQGVPGLEAARLEEVNNIRSMVSMLRIGRVDLAILSEPGFSLLLREMDIPRAEFVKVYDLESVELYYTFNKAFDDAYIKRLQAGLEMLKRPSADGGPSPYDIMCRKYWPQGFGEGR